MVDEVEVPDVVNIIGADVAVGIKKTDLERLDYSRVVVVTLHGLDGRSAIALDADLAEELGVHLITTAEAIRDDRPS